ncbi:unnamed protein product [Brassica rapa]|uniref:AN1-type domain-containing protein n=1 Tax=Brassica campestris TaxID=3711 RepID=A0A3P6CCA3_BRACM|nr:unnamed protein product [Brassica rapa]VDD06112.1 unnamed protein product [Brassica rapa]
MTGEPSLCINGCGFFSTPQTKNLCSKCYNSFLKDESARYLDTIRDHTTTATVVEKSEEAVVVVKNKKRSRCNACNKKVGLLGFECRCGHVFCGSHRHPEEHSCLSDYKSAAITELTIQNPVIKPDKLYRI